MQYGAVTGKGMVRKINQDSFYTDAEHGIFLVCDGMGGHAAGDVASRCAAGAISAYIKENMPLGLDDEKIKELMFDAVNYANTLVYNRSKADSKYHGMGTTVALVMIYLDTVYYLNIGDSRIYLFRDGKIERKTQDHTLTDELLKSGEITHDEAENHPAKHILTRALGTDKETTPDFSKETLLKNDILLLCSDGLTNMLTDREIKQILISEENPHKIAQNLVTKANENGGTDNITAIVVKNPKKELK